ncbi:hypothetical protein E1H12_19090 [Geitlerinema sp. P-1104]|uniref:hypothetical protein n=1 Tax=Geitlerinema sp. P-1104 TaxID=2546230 RepID=UPI001477308F|nr:hypothetical protein [Geitlerinema sp. P-1104]NMG60558.1 hypothetical protein [Geitlerinema sp. P-1104]
MTLNTTLFNWMSRLVLGTATVITLGGMAPEIVQANSTRGPVSDAMFQKGVNGENHEGAIAQFDDMFRQLDDIFLQMAEPFFNRGTQALNNENFEEAISSYDIAISMHSDYAEAYAGRALARAGLNDRSGTISDLEQAARLFQQQGNTAAYNEIQQALQQIR